MEQSEMSDNSDEYEVEAILRDRPKYIVDSHKSRKFLYTEYLIKWVGYEKKTWEPEKNLSNCGQLLSKYKKQKKKLEQIKNNNKNNNASLKNTSRTPIKSNLNRKITNLNNNSNNNKTKEKKDQKENISRESNDKKINEDESTFNNNNNSYNPVYSDEEKYTPMKLNLNHSFYQDYTKLNNNIEDSSISIQKKIDKKRKKELNNDNSLPSNDFDINNENENYLYNSMNNNENNNNLAYSSLSFVGFKKRRDKSKGIENRIREKRKLLEDFLIWENSEKKENSNLEDDISISIDDPFIKMEKESISYNNTNDNSNSNSNINTNGIYNQNKENLELLEIRIPPKNNKKDDQIDLVWRDKEKNECFTSTSKNAVMVPQSVVIDCYEKILKKFLDGKVIKIN